MSAEPPPPPTAPPLLPLSRTVVAVEWTESDPMLRVIDDGRTPSSLLPLIGLRLNYRATTESARRCIGHTPFRKRSTYVDCDRPVEPSSRKCSRCTIVDATYASNLHHAHTRGRSELDASVVAHLDQENKLYLAAFREGSVKVGTSTSTRSNRRLLEQGAWVARIVATSTDGYAVREVEDLVTSELAITQAVSVSRKVDGLVRPLADAELDKKLAADAKLVMNLLDRVADPRIVASDEVWHRPETRENAAGRWNGLHRYPLKLASGNHDFEVVDACGRIAIVRRPVSDDRFAVDLRALFGIELTLGDFDSDEIAIQDSLF